ncbi:MAG: ParA family protein [Treponema sp.]|nr:ParA family protein [Treponema sp.]MBQ5631675.1 ParA family protein [Treponema sp.]MBQ5876240.1 ParA family protein [Treponema sp.]
MVTLCIYNNKGGVGKTSITGALSVEFVIKGKKVLMVDTDAQGNLSTQFMNKAPIENELADYLNDYNIGLETCIYKTRYDNLYIVPSKEMVNGGKIKDWIPANSHQDIIKYLVEDAEKLGFDYLIFDTAPAFSDANKKYMFASDEIIPVLQVAKTSLDGIVNYYVTLKQFKGRDDKAVSNKIIFNQYEKSKAVQKALLPEIMKLPATKYLIPTDQAFRKAELGGIAAQEIGIKPETQEVLNQIIADIEG